MKKFNEWCDQMDAKLKDFNWKDLLYVLFPFSIFLKKKNAPAVAGTVYNTRTSNPIQIKSEKMVPHLEMYSLNTDDGFALDMTKMGIKREICDEIMKSDLFEWQVEHTAMGARVSARIFVHKFEK